MLQNRRDVVPDYRQSDLFHRDAIEQYLAGLRTVEPQQHLDKGCLATTTGANQCDPLSGRYANGQMIEDRRSVTVGETHITHFNGNRPLVSKRVNFRGINGLQRDTDQCVDPVERGPGRVPGILNIEDFLDRAHHEPEVGKNSEHLSDRQVGEKHHQHAQGAEDVETEEKNDEREPRGRIALPGETRGVVTDIRRDFGQSRNIVSLAVGCANLLDGSECFGQ